MMNYLNTNDRFLDILILIQKSFSLIIFLQHKLNFYFFKLFDYTLIILKMIIKLSKSQICTIAVLDNFHNIIACVATSIIYYEPSE